MKKAKGFKYYAFIFSISTIGLFLYLSVMAIQNGGYDVSLLYMVAVVPISFTGFLFVFDKLFDLLLPSKYKLNKPDNVKEYDKFLKNINVVVDNTGEFSIEGFRRLRQSEKFQKALKQSFTILKKGESEAINFSFILKKFKKDTKEYIAINAVVEEVMQLQKNSLKDYQK